MLRTDLPALGWDSHTGLTARRDDDGRWRWLTWTPDAALTNRQVADLLHYRPDLGHRSGMPDLAVDSVTRLTVRHTAYRWHWMDFARLRGQLDPLTSDQAAGLAVYVAVTR